MKKHDISDKTAHELQTMLSDARAKLSQMKFDIADKKLKRTSDIEITRRLIARILTALPKAN